MGLAGGLLAIVLVSVTPRRAHACGGFFCSATAPVVQRGEQIIYAIDDDGALTMSVLINYQGAAPEFAWIVPVPETPTLSLGTTAIFDGLELATRPQFRIEEEVVGTCRPTPTCEFPPPPDAAWATSDGGVFFSQDALSSGPMIYSSGSLGPYETVVLGGASATEIHAWLTTNGYDLPASAIPMLDDYVAGGQRFVALRLRNDASVAEIQPIILSFGVLPPCLPIRLTAIATTPDLPIVAHFLASTRATPRNYSLLEPDHPSELFYGTVPYTTWVSNEIDDMGGQAFVAEYAGPTPTVPSFELPPVDELGTSTDPETMVQQLFAMGYANDALFFALASRFITPPEGTSAAMYLTCLLGGFTCGSPQAFDPAGLVAAIEELIRVPRARARALLDSHVYTTRLFTTMSAEEMTLDPEFVLDDGLGDVDNIHVAIRRTTCDPTRWLEDARVQLILPSGAAEELRRPGYSGSNESYCTRRGGWLPGTDASVFFRDAAVPPGIDGGRPVSIGGGGGCSAFASSRGTGAWWVVSVALLLWSRRRRARR